MTNVNWKIMDLTGRTNYDKVTFRDKNLQKVHVEGKPIAVSLPTFHDLEKIKTIVKSYVELGFDSLAFSPEQNPVVVGSIINKIKEMNKDVKINIIEVASTPDGTRYIFRQ